MATVHVPTPLHSYTRGAREVEVGGADLAAVLAGLDTAFPGIRFRIIDEQDRVRTHIRIFVDRRQVYELGTAIPPGTEVHIMCALSGG